MGAELELLADAVARCEPTTGPVAIERLTEGIVLAAQQARTTRLPLPDDPEPPSELQALAEAVDARIAERSDEVSRRAMKDRPVWVRRLPIRSDHPDWANLVRTIAVHRDRWKVQGSAGRPSTRRLRAAPAVLGGSP